MKRLYLQGIYNEIAGKRDQMLADLSVLLDSPAGIADHGNLSDELKERLEHLCKYDGLMSTFEKYFQSNENSNQPQPTEGESIPNKVINDES